METKCKRTIKKSVCLILSLLMIFGLLSTAPLIAGATAVEETSGEISACRWTYDEDTKTLTISGEGRMELDFEETNFCCGGLGEPAIFSPDEEYLYPESYWLPFVNEIENVVIEEGITNVCSGAFCNHKALKNVRLASTVKDIELYAFAGCVSLETIELPENLTHIGYSAFRDCDLLKEIVFPETLTSIDSYAFYNCNSISGINIPGGLMYIGQGVFEKTAY